MTANTDWLQRSLTAVWHPCTQMARLADVPPLPIARGDGPWLFDTDGRALEALKSIWLNDPTGPLADDDGDVRHGAGAVTRAGADRVDQRAGRLVALAARALRVARAGRAAGDARAAVVGGRRGGA